MISEKPKRILLSKTDMTEDEVNILSNDEAWGIIYSLPKKEKDNRLQVCFTGFRASEKKELVKFAEMNNFKVVTKVTTNLEFLVCGSNAGPSKIKIAEEQGVTFLDGNQFKLLVQTGEISQYGEDSSDIEEEYQEEETSSSGILGVVCVVMMIVILFILVV